MRSTRRRHASGPAWISARSVAGKSAPNDWASTMSPPGRTTPRRGDESRASEEVATRNRRSLAYSPGPEGPGLLVESLLVESETTRPTPGLLVQHRHGEGALQQAAGCAADDRRGRAAHQLRVHLERVHARRQVVR